jgi:thymidine phosphorylase
MTTIINATKKNHAVNPVYAALKSGKINAEQYRAIIAKKASLEDFVKPAKPAKPVYKTEQEKAYKDGKITQQEYENIEAGYVTLGKTKKVKNYMKYYAQKVGIDLIGDELNKQEYAEVAYNDFMGYAESHKGKYANLCRMTANLIADYIEACYC